MKTNSQIRAAAREALSGKWGSAVLLTFVSLILICIFSQIPIAGTLFVVVVAFGAGLNYLKVLRGEEQELDLEYLFAGFKNGNFGKVFTTGLLVYIYIFLWTLLLIVPGIVKSLSYAMTFYIMMDNPEMKNDEAIELSMKMMDGHKMQLFKMLLYFFGLTLLSLLTLGIALLWVFPYMDMVTAAFYQEVKSKYQPAETI